MNFSEAVQSCFAKYVTIEGRAPRSEYWWFVLFSIIGNLIASAIDWMMFGSAGAQIVSAIFSIAIFLPSITVGIRRLHDRDMSGWWMLLILVPILGTVILLVLFVMRGTDGPNRFGADPLRGDGPSSGGPSLEPTMQSSIPRVGRD